MEVCQGPKLHRRRSKGKGLRQPVEADVTMEVGSLDAEAKSTIGSPSKGKECAEPNGEEEVSGDENASEVERNKEEPRESSRKKKRRHRKLKRNDFDSGIGLEGFQSQIPAVEEPRPKPPRRKRGERTQLPKTTSELPSPKKRKRKQKPGTTQEPPSTLASAAGSTALPVGNNGGPSLPDEETASTSRAIDNAAWDWMSMADPWHNNRPCVSSKDGKYFFVVVSTSVKIYSSTTGQVVSTLSPPTSSRKAKLASHTFPISALALNPSNQFQLITASMDGTIKYWDYLDASLIKTVEIGRPITNLSVHLKWKDELFISTLKHRKGEAKTLNCKTNVYRVSLKSKTMSTQSSEAQTPQSTELLGKLPQMETMALSPSGDYLVAIGEDKVYTVSLLEKQENPSFNAFNSREPLTCLAFHPTEDYFATGDKKGQIRFWYCLQNGVQPRTVVVKQSGKKSGQRTQTKMLHWHAHAVAGLAFSPNGAYLLSGGEESVLIVWSLENDQKVFIPRLGSPIGWVSCLVREALEYIVGLDDGTIVLINPVTQKVTQSISQLKLDPDVYPRRERIPLIYHHPSSSIILPSSHPSSLQMYSPTSSRLLTELEISPSNRVSRRDDTPLEHARVDFVVADSSGRWMVTIDSRSAVLASIDKREAYMKFWEWKEGTWILNTRIDGPHGECKIVDLAFQPSALGSNLFASSGEDGVVRLWNLVEVKSKQGTEEFWAQTTELETRSQAPGCLAFSPDGSLLAVAHPAFVTLHDATSLALTLMDTVSCPEIKTVSRITFVGERGRWLACGSQHEVVLWDVIRSCVRWQFSSADWISKLQAHEREELLSIYISPRAEDFSSVEFTGVIIFDANSTRAVPVRTRSLPFKMVNVVHYPLFHNENSKSGSWREVGITDRWRVILFGDHLIQESVIQRQSKMPQKLIGLGLSSGRNLLQDLFGKSALVDLSQPASERPEKEPLPATSSTSNVARLFEVAPHQLPPIESLFDRALSSFLSTREPEEPEAADTVPLIEPTDDVEMADVPASSRPIGKVISDQEVAELTQLFREIPVLPNSNMGAPLSNGKTSANGVHKPKLPNGASPMRLNRKESVMKKASSASPKKTAESAPPSSPQLLTGSKRKIA